jgi:uncharacterized membrane protein YkoI
MHCRGRPAIAIVTVLVIAWASGALAARAPHAVARSSRAAGACLDQKERRAASVGGRVVHLAVAMRAAKRRMPGTVVRARLCHGKVGLVYVLTILGHDGKVARLTVDAARGTLIGKR